MDKKVAAYMEKQESPQKEILYKLRETIKKVFADVHEQIKGGVPYYEGKCYLHALNDHVNLGSHLKGVPEELKKLLKGSGKIMKHVKVLSVSDIDKKSIPSLPEMLKTGD